MGLGKIVEWFAKRPHTFGFTIAGALLPLCFYWALPDFREQNHLKSFAKCAVPPVAVYLSSLLALCSVAERIKDASTDEHTHPGDAKIVRDLEARLREKSPPQVKAEGSKKVKLSISDTATMYFGSLESKLNRATETKNPALALRTAIQLCSEENGYDSSLEFVRDGFDWLEGKKARFSFLAWLNMLNFRWAGCVSRKFAPRKVANYFLSALLESFLNPARSWYYSELGRMVADAFSHPLRKEMYVIHALLASVQHRSDENEAWRDAIRLLYESPIWQRLGESRSIVRVLKNSKFFANTFVFKERASHIALLNEANNLRLLADRVSDVVVPQILYVTFEPSKDNRYTMIMRHIHGETLYKLKKEGKDVPFDRVVEKLAEIHARMPRELPEMKLAYKLRSKLLIKHLGISHKQALSIVKNYRPVYDAVRENAVWVYNKDAHLENWLDCNGKLGVVDCEAEYLVPAHYDLANVFGLDDDISVERLRPYLNKYIVKAKSENLFVNPVTFVRGFYNAFIDRMLSFSSAWSSPARPSLHGERKKALQRAVKAIDIIRSADSEYYELHKESYDNLQLELLKLSAKL